jgi:PleD family two-component response regulator
MILKQAGFESHPFAEPRNAIAACEAMAPDLLITDVVIPE